MRWAPTLALPHKGRRRKGVAGGADGKKTLLIHWILSPVINLFRLCRAQPIGNGLWHFIEADESQSDMESRGRRKYRTGFWI